LRPFKFGVTPYPNRTTPIHNWVQTVQHLEELGYSTIFQYDHFPTQTYDPLTMLASAAVATSRVKLGTLVLDVDFRHPAIMAKAAAAIHIISGERLEFGLGAGWDERDYDMAGIPYDRPIVRIQRLDEALHIIRSMWTEEKTTFQGEHFKITDMEKAGDLADGSRPKIIVGGGGRRVLTVAGRHADIVGIHHNLSLKSRRNRRKWLGKISHDEMNRKIEIVKTSAEEAGRDPDEIEFMILDWTVKITDDPEPIIEELVKPWGLTADDINVEENPYLLVGSVSELQRKIKSCRDKTSVNYIVVGAGVTPEFYDQWAESIVKPLTK